MTAAIVSSPPLPLTALEISIIVPVYNGGTDFRRCLAAVGTANPPALEILVVDDGSTDDSAASAREFGACVIQTPVPRGGPAIARNLGAARARGNILLFVDSDVVLKPDACVRLKQAFSDPQLAACFGSYDDTPAAAAFPAQYKNLLHHYTHQHAREDSANFWAGCGAIRADVFRSIGGFKTTFTRPCVEDIELGYRLARSGLKIRLDKGLQVTHLKAWTLGSMIRSDFFDRALPWTRLLKQTREIPADLNLGTANRVSAALCWLLLLVLLGALLYPLALFVVPVIVITLLGLNADLYRFFLRERGFFFMLGAVPLHWLYYLYSSAAFGYVWFLERE